MSYKGHILCRQCKLKICIGKLRHNDDDQPVGFWGPTGDINTSVNVIMHFLAQHIRHDIIVAGDTFVENIDDLVEYDMLMQVPSTSDWAKNNEPVVLGDITFYRVPCEPLDDR